MLQHTSVRTSEAASPAAPLDRHRRVLAIAGVASLANGAALLAHILGGIALPVLLAITWSTAVVSGGVIAALGDRARRGVIRRTVLVGLATGIVATGAYDGSKAVLSLLDPSPYNPFEVTRIFGTLLIGASAPMELITAAGWAFHVINGCTFAIAYTCLFARGGRISTRRAVVTGVTWALFLETFQLLLYPGWLKIRYLNEFRGISFGAHVVFGAVLGLVAPYGLRRLKPPSVRADPMLLS